MTMIRAWPVPAREEGAKGIKKVQEKQLKRLKREWRIRFGGITRFDVFEVCVRSRAER